MSESKPLERDELGLKRSACFETPLTGLLSMTKKGIGKKARHAEERACSRLEARSAPPTGYIVGAHHRASTQAVLGRDEGAKPLRTFPHPALAAAFAALSLGLCSCVSLFPKAAPVQLYAFGQRPPPPSTPTQAGAVGVVLSTITMPAAAVGDQILSLTGQQAAYIAGARWVVPASVMMQGDAERAFEARSRHVRLLHRGDFGGAVALLHLDVGDFEARYDTPGAAPTVVVSLRASLTRPGGVLIAAQTFTARQPAGENRIAPIVAAYDKAVIEVLDQVVDWTNASAPVASPPR